MPEISIVIPTIGRSDSLPAVLDALAGQVPAPQDAEIIVVCDAAAPPGIEASPGLGHRIIDRALRAEVPGASGARNAGWRAASSRLILFLDDDIVPSPALVREHREWHREHPQAEVAVLGLVSWSHRVKVTPFMRWLDAGIQFDYGTIHSTEVEWQRFYSCNISLKREALELVGGFDEERFPYGYEDLELARRLAEHGLRLLYNPAALGEHLKRETLQSWRRNLRRIARAERRFTQIYPGEHPYFWELFHTAANAAPARGRSARLARFVSPRVPWLGPMVWRSYDMICRQHLAPEFLGEWDRAETERVK
jgi:GT2 family glycosyltransferase